ncbi:MAG: isopentenyl-diphosphate Delta-isomerase [Pseudomonadales bacterium]|nr:isopentenyl-diphosphate Delta-isomerase [Pseudomonadales bacterium]
MSFENNDLLILVDNEDREIGTLSKQACHMGEGLLHRAFSLFVFNGNGELLLQQRSAKKPLWPLYWSNSCCSHPRQSESVELAAKRRIAEELGFQCSSQYLYKFQYHARYKNTGCEHELCHVLVGYSNQPVIPNEEEVAAWRHITPENLSHEINTNPEAFTPWFKQEWHQINTQYLEQILVHCDRFH